MAEQLDLVTPIVRSSTTTWRVVRLELDYGDAPHIGIHLIGSDGSRRSHGYSDRDDNGVYTGVATTMLKALNTANLSTKSLHRRVLERLQVDFPDMAGAVSGTPF